NVLLAPVIDDWRAEEPQQEDVAQEITDVAKVYGQGGQQKRQRCCEDQLNRDRDRKPDEIVRIGPAPVTNQEHQEDRQPEEKVHHVRQDADQRKDFGRKKDLLDQIASRNQRAGRLDERR